MQLWLKALLRRFHSTYTTRSADFYTFYYRAVFAEMGIGSRIYGNITVYQPEHIHVGRYSTFNAGVMMYARDLIQIGDYVRVSAGVILQTATLDYTRVALPLPHQSAPIRIGNGAWLASRALIAPGVTVGERSVVAAGAVVLKDVPPYTIVGGIPARQIGDVPQP